MKIGIIGAGRVGTAFALALAGRGIEVAGICSRTAASFDYLSCKLGREFRNDLQWIIKECDTVLITVSDSGIAGIASKIYEDCPADARGRTFLHCSGALTSEELKALERAGGYTGSLHPIQTFASKEEGWKGMRGIFFGYEGSEEARKQALKLVEILEGTLLDIRAEAKPLYHAAACILSNYTVTLSHVAGMLLDAAGIGKDVGIKAFMPLLKNTVENVAAEGSLKALTGPIARGDSVTVAGHLRAMEGFNGDIAKLYSLLGRFTVQLAAERGSIDDAGANKLFELLK